MIGFVGMLLLFLIMITCRNFDFAKHEPLRPAEFLSVQYYQADNISDLVCLNQQSCLLIAGCIFFLYIGIKIFGAVQKKNRVKKLKFL